VNPKRVKVEPIHHPTLFEMEKLKGAEKPASSAAVERPYSLPGILLGTSAFTANGWQTSFQMAHKRGGKSFDCEGAYEAKAAYLAGHSRASE